MNDIIIIILTSSVVSTIFLAVSNIFIDQRKRSVEYITNERAKWRSDIRKIASEIMEANAANIYKPLTELKVRINAYDRYFNKKRLQNDFVIWKCIEECEKHSTDLELLNIYKNSLVMYLSLMLKYDWERSKREVSIDKNKVLKIILLIGQIIIFAIVTSRSTRGIYYAIELFSMYINFNIFSYMLLQVYERTCSESRPKTWIKGIIHILTAIIIIFFTVRIFGRIDIEISGIFLEGRIKTAFSMMMLIPTEVILLLNILEHIHLIYQIQYFEVIVKHNNKIDEEVKKLLDNRQKNKE